jgi:hypothetical protein
MDDCDSDTGTTNGATGGPLTRSRSKGRLHEPSLNSCRRVQDALGVRLFVLPLYFRIYFYFRMGDSTDVVFCVQGPDGYATHVRAMQMAARSIHDVLNDTLDLHKYVLTGKISMTPRRFDFLRAAFETVEEGESLFILPLFISVRVWTIGLTRRVFCVYSSSLGGDRRRHPRRLRRPRAPRG